MPPVTLADLIPQIAITSRGSVSVVADSINNRIEAGSGAIVFDFTGIQAVGPSVVDELLHSIARRSAGRDVRFANMTSGATWKFEAIARAHRRTLVESGPNSWTFAVR